MLDGNRSWVTKLYDATFTGGQAIRGIALVLQEEVAMAHLFIATATTLHVRRGWTTQTREHQGGIQSMFERCDARIIVFSRALNAIPGTGSRQLLRRW
jgi:hypothetical protein